MGDTARLVGIVVLALATGGALGAALMPHMGARPPEKATTLAEFQAQAQRGRDMLRDEAVRARDRTLLMLQNERKARRERN